MTERGMLFQAPMIPCKACEASTEDSIGSDFELCQDHWEAECARLFWEQAGAGK